MLIDLLDKKAAAENNLLLLKDRMVCDAAPSNFNVILSEASTLIDNIRNYDLLLIAEKSKIFTVVSDQKFNLLQLDCLSKSISIKLDIIDSILSLGKGDILGLLKERDVLQSDLDLVNKASDEAIWKAELDG